jgi:hypothetical protein
LKYEVEVMPFNFYGEWTGQAVESWAKTPRDCKVEIEKEEKGWRRGRRGIHKGGVVPGSWGLQDR